MSIEQLSSALPDYAKDIRLNLGVVLTEEGASELSQRQIYLIALASAYAVKHQQVISSIEEEASSMVGEKEINAAKAAATIMAMNNIYYRFIHMISDKTFSTMPAKLRMNVIGNPGIDKVDFELMSLAVSAINGCGMCVDSHTNALTNAGVAKVGVQSAVRIAAVVNAVAAGLAIAK